MSLASSSRFSWPDCSVCMQQPLPVATPTPTPVVLPASLHAVAVCSKCLYHYQGSTLVGAQGRPESVTVNALWGPQMTLQLPLSAPATLRHISPCALGVTSGTVPHLPALLT